MSTHIIRASDEDQAAIDQAVQKNFYVEKRDDGVNYIELYADHNDTNEFLLQAAYDHRNDAVEPPKDYEPENGLLYALQDAIAEGYDIPIWEAEDNILRDAGFDPSDDKAELQREYLRDKYCICPPYDHFLDQSMKVNIMLKTPEELNQDFGLLRDQYLAMARPDELCDSSPEAIQELLSADSSLKRLVEQQGHTMEELAATMKDYMKDFYDENGSPFGPGEHPQKYLDENGKSLPYETRMDLFTAGRSKFLASLCEELDNHTYSMGCITVLAEVSMNQFVDMMKPNSEITMACDATVGIFNPWNGSGSILGVYLARPLTFTRDDIYDVQVEGADLDYGYSLDRSFGMVDSAWKNPASIHLPEERKPSLDNLIRGALKVQADNLEIPAEAKIPPMFPGRNADPEQTR